MNQIVDVFIWWTGALLCLVALIAVTSFLVLVLNAVLSFAAKRVASITRMTTARYWIYRMEREGLTICMKDYRQMVAERKPKSFEQFDEVDRAWEAKRGKE